jgi:hypothetical protein
MKHPHDHKLEQRVRSWLATHYCVISRHEALEIGLTAAQIRTRVQSGAWEVACRGVYHLAGAPLGPMARLRVAAIVGGPGSAVSHLSAAWLWGVAGPCESVTIPTVTVPRRRLVRVAGIRIVRNRHPVRVVMRKGLPCTDPVRTIVDCATDVTPAELDDLVDRALAHKIVAIERLAKAVAGGPEFRHHRGRPLLLAHFHARGVSGSPHPSVLESRMARVLRRCNIPEPKAEVCWGPDRRYRLDFAFADIRLVIEVDGWAGHFAPEKRRSDHQRDRRLWQAGWTVLRYDWWEVTYDAARVAQEIAETYRGLAAVA